VVVEHIRPDGSTIYSSYKHLEEVTVVEGDLVDRHTRIGRLFNEAEYAASPFKDNHLHFEMRHSMQDRGEASWTSMTIDQLKQYAFDPWDFFTKELSNR